MATLLVLDDDRVQRTRAIRAAAAAGFGSQDILEAGTLDEGLSAIEIRKIDFAVVDIVLTALPERLGLTAISRLRAAQRDCTVIGLTSLGGPEIGVAAMRAGANDFVSTRWDGVNWFTLLTQRLSMWRGVGTPVWTESGAETDVFDRRQSAG